MVLLDASYKRSRARAAGVLSDSYKKLRAAGVLDGLYEKLRINDEGVEVTAELEATDNEASDSEGVQVSTLEACRLNKN